MSNTSSPPANAAISVRTTAANSKWLNAVSPKSGKTIAVGDQVVLCPKCYTPHLLQDWRENDNKCAIDGTPARVIERAARAPAGEGAAAAPAAPAAPAAAPRASAAAAGATPVATAAPAVSAGPVDPYRYAKLVDAPPESDVWRRNIMTVVVLLFLWGLLVLVVTLLGLDPRGA